MPTANNDWSILLDGFSSCYSDDLQIQIQTHIDSKQCILVFNFKALNLVVEWQLNSSKICPVHTTIIGYNFMFFASLYLCTHCSSAPTVPLYPVFLCYSVPNVPQYLCTLCTSVPTVPLYPLFFCTHCSSVPLYPVFLRGYSLLMFNYLGARYMREWPNWSRQLCTDCREDYAMFRGKIQRCESNLARPTEKRMWNSFLSSWHILQLQSTAYDHDWLFE